jgi:hypothetical protein
MKVMKKQLSDEQFDALMRTLVNESAADEAMLTEIADSPTIWWGVQRKINEQKDTTLSAWPPVGKFLRWLMIGVPVTAAAVLIISFFVFRPAPDNGKDTVAAVSPSTSMMQQAPEIVSPGDNAISAHTKEAFKDSVLTATKSVKESTKPLARQISTKLIAPVRTALVKTTELTAKASKSKKEEIKTEFIALSYARDPESGQIVRVKVPSSMMVSLGLVTSVKTPSEMIDAEVLVGDDGLTRAIRFIR